jgi:hypothetical protein
MSERTPTESTPNADDAMSRALQAEQRALEAIEACRHKAAALAEATQRQARSIRERADRRIGELHARCVRVTAEQIDAMLHEDAREAERAAQPNLDSAALEEAVERVARYLIDETKAGDESH